MALPASDVVRFAVYGALFGAMFLLVLLQLQYVAGYSPLASGAATLPITIMMLLPIGNDTSYLTSVFADVMVFAIGLTLLVAPQATVVLGAAPNSQ